MCSSDLGGLVANGAAVSGENLQQQITQGLVAGFGCGEGRGVGHKGAVLAAILACGPGLCPLMRLLHRLFGASRMGKAVKLSAT